MTEKITLAHSPDSDDAFMFYGLATNKLDTGDFQFEHLLKDIQTLNEEAMRGTYDVTAISFHAYAYIHDKYALLPHGASIGDNYGPVVVSREHLVYDLGSAKRFRRWSVITVEKNRSGQGQVELEVQKDFEHGRFLPDAKVVTERLVEERVFTT